ncbi:hypothetical protein FPV67DRAFT_1675784 [Lyophyllum atratum]|nr:hypothetical protein FPV67DRAFT_1675784 [Lyophyllum atratum]
MSFPGASVRLDASPTSMGVSDKSVLLVRVRGVCAAKNHADSAAGLSDARSVMTLTTRHANLNFLPPPGSVHSENWHGRRLARSLHKAILEMANDLVHIQTACEEAYNIQERVFGSARQQQPALHALGQNSEADIGQILHALNHLTPQFKHQLRLAASTYMQRLNDEWAMADNLVLALQSLPAPTGITYLQLLTGGTYPPN